MQVARIQDNVLSEPTRLSQLLSSVCAWSADKTFNPDLFVRKIQRCLDLSGRGPNDDISNSAYNVGTFHKYMKKGDAGGIGVKKRNAV